MKMTATLVKTTALVMKTIAPVMKTISLVIKTTALVLVKSINLVLELLILHQAEKDHFRSGAIKAFLEYYVW